MKIVGDFRNELLKRREVGLLLKSERNLGFENAMKKISEEFKANAEDIVVKNVKNNFGSPEFLIEAFIYDSKEHKEMFEPRKKEKKKQGV